MKNTKIEKLKMEFKSIPFDEKISFIIKQDQGLRGGFLFWADGWGLNEYATYFHIEDPDICDKIERLNLLRFEHVKERGCPLYNVLREEQKRFNSEYNALNFRVAKLNYVANEKKKCNNILRLNTTHVEIYNQLTGKNGARLNYRKTLLSEPYLGLIISIENAIHYYEFLENIPEDGTILVDSQKDSEVRKPPKKEKSWEDFFRNDSNELDKFRKLKLKLSPETPKDICILIKALKDFEIGKVKDYGGTDFVPLISSEFGIKVSSQAINRHLTKTPLTNDTYKYYLDNINRVYQVKS